MDDKEMEGRLGEFDFSQLSPVRAPLLQKLLTLHRSQMMIAEGSGSLWAQRLDDEALDEVAAAGNLMMTEKPKDNNKR